MSKEVRTGEEVMQGRLQAKSQPQADPTGVLWI